MEENAPQSSYVIPLAIIVAGILVAGAIYFGGNTSKGTNPNSSTGENSGSIEISPVTDKDHIIGSRNAKLVIIEYSDTECPFCKIFHDTMKEVLRMYGDEVAWVYRHFPIAQLHSRAVKEAEATECAAELGGNQGFWNYIDTIFERTNSNDTLDPSQLPIIAGDIGLDVPSFNNCLSSGRYNALILESVKGAVQAGARGTPYSVIMTKDGDHVVINGAEPLELVQGKLDSLLAN